jgi:hypothetical protein
MDLEASDLDIDLGIVNSDTFKEALRQDNKEFEYHDRKIKEHLGSALDLALKMGKKLFIARRLLGNRKFKPYLDDPMVGIKKTSAYGYIYVYRNQDEIKRLVQSGLSLKKAIQLFKKANRTHDPKQDELNPPIKELETHIQQIRRPKPKTEKQKFKDRTMKSLKNSIKSMRATRSMVIDYKKMINDERDFHNEKLKELDKKEEIVNHMLVVEDVKRKDKD